MSIEIFAKAEFLNPGSSIKDRIAKHMLELVGVSAGANVWAAMQVARGTRGLRIATILPDRAERYFSCNLI